MDSTLAAAVVASAVSLVLWSLARIPAFTYAGRLMAAIDRDLRILERLPAGAAHDRLKASIDGQVVRLLVVRGEGTGEEMRSFAAEKRDKGLRAMSVSGQVLMVIGAVLAFITAIRALTSGQVLSTRDVALVIAAVSTGTATLVGLLRAAWRSHRHSPPKRPT